MSNGYEINDLAKEESWRMFRIIGEFVEGFDTLNNIEPAVAVYGSARLKETDDLYAETVEISRRLGEMGLTVITGGGPGVMEAANKGALQAGAASIGLNIELPGQEYPNSYTTRAITFHHFFIRKVMLVKYTSVFIIMPGGMGTLDELTEVLTLMQTHKIKPFPVILYKSNYWQGLLQWLKETVLLHNFISKEDLNLLRMCDDADEVVDSVKKWYTKRDLSGKKAIPD